MTANKFHRGLFPDLPYFCQVEINTDGNCHLSHSHEPGISLILVSLQAGLSGKANQEVRQGTAALASLLCPLTEMCQTPRASLEEQIHLLQKYLEEPGYFHSKRYLHMLVWGKDFYVFMTNITTYVWLQTELTTALIHSAAVWPSRRSWENVLDF